MAISRHSTNKLFSAVLAMETPSILFFFWCLWACWSMSNRQTSQLVNKLLEGGKGKELEKIYCIFFFPCGLLLYFGLTHENFVTCFSRVKYWINIEHKFGKSHSLRMRIHVFLITSQAALSNGLGRVSHSGSILASHKICKSEWYCLMAS